MKALLSFLVVFAVGVLAPQAFGATLYVATHGVDSARCTRAEPCASFNRAYHAAAPGDTVEIAAGSYASPSFTHDATKDTATSNVLFRPAAGATVTVAGTMTFNAAHITVDGIHFTGYGAPTTNASGFLLKFSGQDCYTHDVVVRNSTGVNSPGFQILNGSHDITLYNDDFGNYGFAGVNQPDADIAGTWTETCNGSRAPNVYNIVLDHTTIHDVYWGIPQAQWGGAHPDCLEAVGATGDPNNPFAVAVTIRNSVFYHCGNSFMMLGATNLSSFFDCCNSYGILIENNVFWGLGNDSYYGIQIRDDGNPYACGGYTFVRNTYAPENPSALGPYSPILLSCRHGVNVTGNVFERAPSVYDCRMAGSKVSWSSNVYVTGVGCGGGRGVPLGYVYRGRKLQVVTELAKPIRTAFQLAASGTPLTKLPAALKRAKAFDPRVSRVPALRTILRDRVYAGSVYGAPATNPAIVSATTWRRAQRAFR